MIVMSKKKQKEAATRSSERTDLAKFCAFWGIAIAATLFVTGGIIHIIINAVGELSGDVKNVLDWIYNITSFLGQLALLVGVAIPAYRYTRGKTKGWRIFYWIALAVYAFGVVFGLIGSII